jgi:branched-chain amino acid transport system substrate-binding protein
LNSCWGGEKHDIENAVVNGIPAGNTTTKEGKVRKFFIIAAMIIVAVTLVLSGCPSPETTAPPTTTAPTTTAPTTPSGPQTLTIGAVWGLTGPGADISRIMRMGEDLCKDWINSNGGITVNGQQYLIELIVEDTKGSAEGGVTAAQKLVFQNKVKFVVGHTVATEVMAVRSVTDPNKVLYCADIGPVSGDFPYTFTAKFGNTIPKSIEYDYLQEAYPDVKVVAMMNQDEAMNIESAEAGMAEVEKRGLELGIHLVYPFDTADYLPLITKVVATKPDAIDLNLAYPADISSMVKYARQQGFTGPMFANAAFDPNMMIGMIGAEYATDFFIPTLDTKDPAQRPSTYMTTMIDLWGETYKDVPFFSDSMGGWNSLQVLSMVLEKAQSLDPTQVADTFTKMGDFVTIYGPSKMGGQKTYGFNGMVVADCPMTRIQNGKPEFIGWIPVDIP